jgi:hypothetical protein
VYEAYKAVKSDAGAAGVDGQTIRQLEADFRSSIYKRWNRTLPSVSCRIGPERESDRLPCSDSHRNRQGLATRHLRLGDIAGGTTISI